MVVLLVTSKKCPACNKQVEGTSGSAVWHDECWDKHHKQNRECTAHSLCKKAYKEGW